jgi:hypothetical protein
MSSKRFRLRFTFWLDVNKEDEAEIADKVEKLKQDRLFVQTIRDGIRLICDLRDGKLDVLFELFPWVKAEFMEYIREVQPVPSEESRGNELPEASKPVTQQTPQQIHAEKQWLEAEQERLEAERQWHEKRMRDAEKALAAEREKIESERRQTQGLLQQQLERLEKLLLQQGNKPISGSGGLQSLGNGGGGPSNSGGLNSLTTPQFSPPIYDDDDDDLTLEVKKAKGDSSATQNFLKSMQALQQ